MQLRQQVKAKVAPTLGKSTSVKSVLQRAVFDELVALVDPTGQASTTAGPAPPVFKPVKNRTNVLMAVGLQGAGKTTSCSKLAAFYQRKGFKTCLVCADTFRAGACAIAMSPLTSKARLISSSRSELPLFCTSCKRSCPATAAAQC